MSWAGWVGEPKGRGEQNSACRLVTSLLVMATDWEKTSNVWPRPAFAALSQHLKGMETVLYQFCQPPVRTWVLTGIPIWHLTGKVVLASLKREGALWVRGRVS